MDELEEEGESVSRFAMRSGVMAFELLLDDQPAEDSLRMLSFILSDRSLDGVGVAGIVVEMKGGEAQSGSLRTAGEG